MEDLARVELGALRARAYGPRADIDADPAALARLRELEEAERAARSRAEPAPPDPVLPEAGDGLAELATALGAAQAGPGSRVTTPDAGEEVAAHGAPPVAAPTRPVAVGWLIAWAASILVVAVAVGAIVFGLASIRPVSTETGARQVATLDEPIDVPEWMAWFGESASGVYSYGGLLVARTPRGFFTPGEDCIFVAARDAFNEADGSLQGNLYSDCRAGVFPATVQFVVDESSPEELRDAFPIGTALQFVVVGDLVGVFSDEGATADT